jgi:flagellar basal-body rod protein FlgC
MNTIPSETAFQSFAVRQQVSANNVANMNTDGFDPSRVDLEERPERQGVQVQDIRSSDEGPPQVNGDRVEVSPEGEQAANGKAASQEREPSETDVAQEMVTMMQNRTAYSANATVVRTENEMAGELMRTMA